jgi:hypothetical protein
MTGGNARHNKGSGESSLDGDLEAVHNCRSALAQVSEVLFNNLIR